VAGIIFLFAKKISKKNQTTLMTFLKVFLRQFGFPFQGPQLSVPIFQ